MPRQKTLPDSQVLAAARRLYAQGGEKSVSFGSVARATGLAGSTLAQRYGSVEGMLSAAARDGWAVLTEAATAADAATTGKGPQGFLKALDPTARKAPLLLSLGTRDPVAREAGAVWRAQIEAALARRIGSGEKARSAAQVLFAVWQGQILWEDPEIRIKDLARRLT
ncbi:TetR/AcrR family transcriptional regulator [Pseudogemmobacter blasticus]|uniref:Transcriptional regulator n=1 Tax=Fuscovulum blasticum DSM 2131 TaxID=1188250 RepID=A0A2T4JC14_FUSBL|nr:TetR/AcrR family transcriptional regulator [Fuscovulum blasticum]AWD22412.1 hypothetical protein B6K69_12625 [Fuscovulum blasticum]PTE15393.1 transcriptional regulator [Fuscovulum blasticum DSM 2131]